jgi:anti-sigma regulatory factor (Ser/Thr protein kinase)
MMPEIAMSVLDIAQNSVRAKATLIQIEVLADQAADRLTVRIIDDGCGMTPEQVAQVEDPFFTTRTTRKVGLGVPFFKQAALAAGGSFRIDSRKGAGTTVTAVFTLSSIDRMPLGDINGAVHTLIRYNPDLDVRYRYQVDDRSFELDTRQFRALLEGVPLDTPEVSQYISEYLSENKTETDQGVLI